MSNKVKEIRKLQGLTQQELADKASLSKSHISRVERGIHDSNIKTLVKIAEALGVEFKDLF